MTRAVFFGTPDEAIPTLRALADSVEVGLVVTQPDRAKGRSDAPVAPPVKRWATGAGLPVAQPRTHSDLEIVVGREFDVGVVVAYGRILRPAVLDATRFGMLNVHFSLLPRWRGAAPVARALMAGDRMTGVTIIKLDEGLDTGPVLTAQAVDVGERENAGQLGLRLAGIGAVLLRDNLTGYLDGALRPVPQSDDGVTYASKVESSDRPLDADDDPLVFVARVRGLSTSPGATLNIDGVTHKVLDAVVAEGVSPDPSTWVASEGWPVVGVGDNGVRLVSLQSPGRRPQSGDDWLRGVRRRSGVIG
jgi:methionyl-tRNA formyltransferase